MHRLCRQAKNEDMRLHYCEYCGRTPGAYETHHITPKGMGGASPIREIRANKINLCVECHDLAHDEKVERSELYVRVAVRENVAVREVYEANKLAVPENIEELETEKEELKQERTGAFWMPNEQLISALIDLEHKEDELHFVRGQIIEVLVERGFSQSYIASQSGRSTAYVRLHLRTYRAFRDESTRNPFLSWTHHRIAAETDDPAGWIEKAAEEQMSTREMARLVKEHLGKSGGNDQVEEASEEVSEWRCKAEKVLSDVKEIFDSGDEAAQWLWTELEKIFKEKVRGVA